MDEAPGRSRSRASSRLWVRPIVLRLRRADGDLRLELEEILLADAADVHQLLDFLERTVLLAVLDDPRSGLRADAGERIELRRGRGVDIDDHRGRWFWRRGRLGLRERGRRQRGEQQRESGDREQRTQHRILLVDGGPWRQSVPDGTEVGSRR